MNEDRITITIDDVVARQLDGVNLDETSRKRVKLYQLKKLKEQHQASIDDINAEIAELRK